MNDDIGEQFKDSLDPYGISFIDLSETFQEETDWPEAIREAKRGVELAPDDPDAHYRLAFAFTYSEDIKSALRSFREVVRLEPDNTNFLINLGMAHLELDDTISARQFYEKALKIDPDYVPAIHLLGTLEEEEGRLENAIRFYRRAVKTEIPDDCWAEQSLSQEDAKSRLYGLSEHFELVTIVKTDDQAEAEFLGHHLEGKGFLVFLDEDEDPDVIDDVVEIMVPFEDAKDALAAIEPLRGIAKYLVGDELGNIDTGWGECTKCKSRDISLPPEEDPHWTDLFRIFLFFRRSLRHLICNTCGFEWSEP